MSRNPLVSIITPSLNQGEYIRQAIASVFAQDYPNIEYIVMDGGSTDDTVEILKLKKKPRFYWESKKDKGQADAINKGLRRAKGELVGYLNSDDYYVHGAISAVVKHFREQQDLQWMSGDYRIVDGHGREIQRPIRWYKYMLRVLKIPLTFTNFIAQPSTFWRRSILGTIGFFDTDLHYTFDYDYWLRLTAKFPPGIIHDCLSAFRIHGKSKGGSMYRKQFEEEERVLMRYTDSKIMLKLHQLHTKLITYVYDKIK